jgi:hypothetical protein
MQGMADISFRLDAHDKAALTKLAEKQRPFGDSLDQFARRILMEAVEKALKELDQRKSATISYNSKT